MKHVRLTDLGFYAYYICLVYQLFILYEKYEFEYIGKETIKQTNETTSFICFKKFKSSPWIKPEESD